MTTTDKPAAVLALAQGRSNSQAATAAGVSTRTILRWLESDDFRRDVAESRTMLLRLAVGRLAAASVKAVDTLVDALDTERGQARVQAAKVLLESTLALRESLDVEERLAALEAESRGR
ncbi:MULTISPECIES: helix-turn-helix domain-containing protein [unclassified Streptomyces]|uniref:helix-turn-helix domain-containing protein n=1 Tax=unclassified Streptomyces TaxID=2593676 RepID=UPI0004C881F4|nr:MULTISPECIES: helix-turn-helix domain-containing protein [unclassified Streptomyces]KJY18385.1 hypothetical protein VR43_25180 [Streptomyces sp. NRRL S-104]